MGSCTRVEGAGQHYIHCVTGRLDADGLLALVGELHGVLAAEPPGMVRLVMDCRGLPFRLDARLMTLSKRLHADVLREHTLRIAFFGVTPAAQRLVRAANLMSSRTTVLVARDEDHAKRLVAAGG